MEAQSICRAAGICRAKYHRRERYLKVEFQESVLGVPLIVHQNKQLCVHRVKLHKARQITMNRESTTTENLHYQMPEFTQG